MQLGGNWEMIGLWYAMLLIFGIAYNALINWAEKHGYIEGYTWLSVVVGVAVTVILTGPIIGWTHTILVFIAFCFSGCPMSAGAIWRYVSKRKYGADQIRSEGHDAAKEVAPKR